MINNSKQNCIDDLSVSLTRSSNWRRGLQSKFNDPRNGRAPKTLDKLAGETNALTDEAWSELKPFYNWASGKWSEAVSQTSRQVGVSQRQHTFGLREQPSRHSGSALMASLSTALRRYCILRSGKWFQRRPSAPNTPPPRAISSVGRDGTLPVDGKASPWRGSVERCPLPPL
jgi:hypothetical protein